MCTHSQKTNIIYPVTVNFGHMILTFEFNLERVR